MFRQEGINLSLDSEQGGGKARAMLQLSLDDIQEIGSMAKVLKEIHSYFFQTCFACHVLG